MCLKTWVSVAQIVGYLGGLIILGITVASYKKNNKVKRAEWLKSLYEKFFESDLFKEVRKAIDYNKLNSYLEKDKFGKIHNYNNEEKFVDYLNFFQFISVLKKRKHIKDFEIKDMFNYYIKALKRNDFVLNYLAENGFYDLKTFLIEYS